MTPQQRDMAIGDFEKYMRYAVKQNEGFTLENFIFFSTSLINFYQGSDLISHADRRDIALILSQSFNAGLGNRITPDDLHEIAQLIISDSSIDYSVLNPIFG
ncbi:hypothetical protein [Sphingobacterium griseoflavum]|uniref:Uncharacterized protein n=1 Tax=Sphingobacterium griseoflavum TaxID=1474952 RepID=A0ABQ3HPV1_9SPHI|nr:hypothetical protein [Sphingobacterium griseoflavum]GHE23268.1 hypothetical protein GCM10017764_02360 [Sphingobacterium griseoflavum]